MAQNAAQTKSVNTEKPEFTGAFSSFSVKDIPEAKRFYGDTLGLNVEERSEGLELTIDGQSVFIYPKTDHQAATFTVLNLMVDDIASAVNSLKGAGITFESYDQEEMKTDENNIAWGKRQGRGPNIAWFRDPAGNFVSVIEK